MSIIVKRQKKKDRGYNFKIMNRDADDPLFHDPNVSNQVLVHAPTRSEMKEMRKDKARELPDYLQTVNDTYDLEGYDDDKDLVDYAFEEFNKKMEEGEGEADAEGDYDFEDYDVDAEGDDDYEFLGFNNKVDKEFAEEFKNNYKYKPAEGIKMVEYDAFGLPKTEEMTRMKKELNMKDEDLLRDDGAQVLFIKPPEEYKMYGYHKNVDIERKNMTQDMKEVYDMMQDKDGEVLEDECIDDDFLQMLNENQPAMVEKTSEEYAEEYKDIEYNDELGEGDEEAMMKAREEADAMLQNMPMGLSDDMQMRLAGARELLAQKNSLKISELPETQEEIDDHFQGVMDEYQDDDLGAINDEMMDPLTDMIDQEAFDEIMQEFIESNKEQCKKLYTKYHDDDFNTKIKVDGEAVEEVFETAADGITDKIYKVLRQKNGELVKLVPKEEMHRIQEKMNAEEIAKTKAAIKAKILKLNEEALRAEAEEDLEDIDELDEDEEQEKKWDVETVLSTRTNTDNHPGLIKGVVRIRKDKIKLDPKTKLPEVEINGEQPTVEKPKKTGPYTEEIVSESDSDGEGEGDDEIKELKDLETMSEQERKKYLLKLNKKQVKKEKKERRIQKKKMKTEFAKQHRKYAKVNTVGKGEIRPGTSVRKL